jgi:hypothetical protein
VLGLPLLRCQTSGSPISLSTDYRGEEADSDRSDRQGGGDNDGEEELSPKSRAFLRRWIAEDEYSPMQSDEGTWAEEYFWLKFQDLHILDEEDNEEGQLYDELIRAIEVAHTDPGPSTSQAVDVLREESLPPCQDPTTAQTRGGSTTSASSSSHADHCYRGPHQHRDCMGTMGFCDNGGYREVDHTQRDDEQASEPLTWAEYWGELRHAH